LRSFKKALDRAEVCCKNFDIDANDQTKQGPEPEIGTETQNGQESKVTDGGDTSTNKPSNSIGTDVISPGDNSDTELSRTGLPRGYCSRYLLLINSRTNTSNKRRNPVQKSHLLPSNGNQVCS